MIQFKDRIQEERKKRGWRQKDVATKLGITDVAYGDYERGRIYPSRENLRFICQIFDLDFNEMADLIEEEKRQEELKRNQQRIRILRREEGEPSMVDFVKVLLERKKQSTETTLLAAAPDQIDLNVAVPALVLNTMKQTFVQVINGPFFSPDGRLSLDIRIPDAHLPVEPEPEVKVDLLFLPLGGIVHTFTLSPARQQHVEVELPTEDPDLKDLLKELTADARGPMRLPLATVSFRIR